MELKQLKYFTRVADLGGFSKAALSLSISQPALSKKLRQLELELRRDLLLRNGRGVTLTDEGLIFLEHARIMLDQAERAKQEIEDITGAPGGKVILACASAIDSTIVARIFAAFRSRFPKASLELIEIKGWTVFEWLLHGRADIGILYDAHPTASMKVIPLRSTEMCLISPRKDKSLEGKRRISFKQLGDYPLILPGNPRAIKLSLERAAEHSDSSVNAVFQVEGVANILELVRQGYGHTIMPRDMVAAHPLAPKLLITPLAEPKLTSVLGIAVPAKRRLSHLCEQTIKVISEVAGEPRAAPRSTARSRVALGGHTAVRTRKGA